MEYFQIVQYVFIGVALIVLLVRAVSIRERVGAISGAREDIRAAAKEAPALLQRIIKAKVVASTPDRLVLLQRAQRLIQSSMDALGPDGSNWRLDLLVLAIFVDILIDLFGVAVMLMFAAELLGAFSLNIDILRVLLGAQVLGSLIFPYVLTKITRACEGFLLAIEMKAQVAEEILEGTVPKHISDILVKAERTQRISG